jgi:hypothetical protein
MADESISAANESGRPRIASMRSSPKWAARLTPRQSSASRSCSQSGTKELLPVPSASQRRQDPGRVRARVSIHRSRSAVKPPPERLDATTYEVVLRETSGPARLTSSGDELDDGEAGRKGPFAPAWARCIGPARRRRLSGRPIPTGPYALASARPRRSRSRLRRPTPAHRCAPAGSALSLESR